MFVLQEQENISHRSGPESLSPTSPTTAGFLFSLISLHGPKAQLGSAQTGTCVLVLQKAQCLSPNIPKQRQVANLLSSCGLPVLGSADDERYGGSLATTTILKLSWGGQIN